MKNRTVLIYYKTEFVYGTLVTCRSPIVEVIIMYITIKKEFTITFHLIINRKQAVNYLFRKINILQMH